MEKKLIASQNFIWKYGAQEEKIIKCLEKFEYWELILSTQE
jgi:hypothetical protein